MTASRIQAALGDYDRGGVSRATGRGPDPLCDSCGSKALHRVAGWPIDFNHRYINTYTLICTDCKAHHRTAQAAVRTGRSR